MAIFYPHKQTVVVAVISAIAVVGTALYVHGQIPPQNNQWAQEADAIKVIDDPSPTPVATTDNWRSAFFTDNGKSAPAKSANSGASGDTGTSNAPLTLTDKFSREFFTNYMELRQANLTSNDKAVSDAVDQTISDASEASAQPKLYSATDISTSPAIDEDTLHSYGNILGAVLISDSPISDAPTIATNAMDSGNMSLLSGIDSVVTSYNKMAARIKAMVVPEPLSADHLRLLNAVSSLSFVSESLRHIDTDPMQSMVAISLYTTSMDSMRTSLQNIKVYLNNIGVSFAQGEPGTILSAVPTSS